MPQKCFFQQCAGCVIRFPTLINAGLRTAFVNDGFMCLLLIDGDCVGNCTEMSMKRMIWPSVALGILNSLKCCSW